MEMLSSASMGLAVVCFWQKEFVIDDLVLVTILLAGAALPSLAPAMTVALGLAAVLLTGWDVVSKLKSALLKNWRMFMLASALFALHQHGMLVEFRHFSIVAWASGCVQLLREPAPLKLRLREWRIALGPIYTMAATRSFVHYTRIATDRVGASAAIVGALAVVVASLALRPDNQELDAALLRWLLGEATAWPRTFGTRAKCHGLLMLLSLVLLTLLLLAKGEHFLVCSFLSLLVMEVARRMPVSQVLSVASTFRRAKPLTTRG